MYGTDFAHSYVAYRKVGRIVEMLWDFSQPNTDAWTAGKLPDGFRPVQAFIAPAVATNSNGVVANNTASVYVAADGSVTFTSAASVSGAHSVGHTTWIARQ